MKLDPHLSPHRESNPKYSAGRTMKGLAFVNIAFWFGLVWFYTPLEAQETKDKINEWT